MKVFATLCLAQRLVVSIAACCLLLCSIPADAQTFGVTSDKSRNFALLVACSDYDKKELKPLTYPQNDVLEFHKALLEAGFEKDNVIVMHDTQSRDYLPESRKIREQLELLLARVGRNDTLVVALAGHGVQFRGDNKNYFCPLDARLKDASTLIALDEVYRQMQECRAQRKLLLVDACRNDPQSNLGRSRAEVDLESVTRPQIEAVPEGIVALFSCSAGQQSFEHPELKHGIFFYHLLEGWRGKADSNKDHRLTLDELVDYTKHRTESFAHLQLKAIQIPQQKGDFSGVWSLRQFSFAPSTIVTPVGNWQITHSLNFADKSYGGTLSVQVRDGLQYLNWYGLDGNLVQTGLGFFQDGHLFSSWGTERNYGFVLYKIGKDGTLEGRWSSCDERGIGTETCTPMNPAAPDGTFHVRGTTATSGDPYKGTMAISQTGDTYHAAWSVAEGKYYGVGIRNGDWLAITYALRSGGSYGVVDFTVKDQGLEGRWTMSSQQSLRAEILARLP